MDKRNLTISIPRSLARKAKIEAAKADKSLNQFIVDSIKDEIGRRSGYKRAMKKHLEQLSAGYDLGTEGKMKIARESIHER